MAFEIKEHVIACQHIRQNNSTDSQNIRLAVKQYLSKRNPSPQQGDVTIIAAHANGFVKVRLVLRTVAGYHSSIIGAL